MDEELAAGRSVRLCTKDLMRAALTGAYILPDSLRPDCYNIPQCSQWELAGYCSSVLYSLRPNGGSLKKELWGRHLMYEFIPKEE